MDATTPINHLNGSEIAVVGMVCRFPGARSVDEFWRNLRDGVESISFLKDEELEQSGVDPAQQTNPHYVKAASILDEVEWFDAGFFGLTPREAEIMDPQQRLFLECAWEALENAGYDPDAYAGAIGLFAGARTNTYLFNIYSHEEIVKSLGAFQIGLGNDFAFLSTRVSYKLNLRGPSYSVHTACSTSLVAVHLACQSLLTGECQIALAGGVAVSVPQKTGYLYQPGGIVSPDGHCRAFDAKAQGTIFGSGVGIIVLKRLEDALADGDHIQAVIKGSAVNNDGSLKASFTAPNVQSQAEVIADAIANAEVEPETISYVEAHGTGTALGDAIEIRALTKAFGAHTEKKSSCAIGSVKTNFGHLDAAAGAAGLLKTILSLKNKQLPPTLHFEAPHPNIDFASSPFYVNARLTEWKRNGTPRRASVSSFGVGGTNAHVVLEEAPPREASGESRPQQLIVLSAQSPSALDAMTANLAAHLREHADLNLADVAYTLAVGRKGFGFRRMLVERALEDVARSLETLDTQRLFTQYQEVSDPPVVFMFPGQGAQHVNMGLDLYNSEPTFREHVDNCAELLKSHLGLDIRTVLYPKEEDASRAREQLNQTWLTQPVLFTVEYALARLWMQWGIHPQVMIGHSIGEYVAACLSGVLTLEDALAVVAVRGRLMQDLPGGSMLAVPLAEADIRPLMNGKLYLAAVNEPGLCVASGPAEAVAELEQKLAQRGLASRRLPTSHAFHSQMMEPVVAPFIEQIKQFSLRSLEVPYVSNVTGTWMTAEEAADPQYWGRHLRQTVRFADGLELLLKEQGSILLEVGPGQTLSRLVKRHPRCTPEQVVLSSMRHPEEEQTDGQRLMTTLGQLWLNGVSVDWPRVYAGERRHRVVLPTYPFERQRYWISLQAQTNGHKASAAATAPASPAKEANIADWFYRPSWRPTPLLRKASALSREKKCWVVFSDETGLGASLAARLQEEAQEVVTVRLGQQFSRTSETVFTVNPEAPEDYRSLFKELSIQGKTPRGIAHLWSLTPKGQVSQGRDSFDQAQVKGFYSLLYLARALRSENLTEPIELWVVSNGLRQVESRDVVCPEKTTMLGACTVVPQEFANLTCRTIDLRISDTDAESLAIQANQIIAEIGAATTDRAVAYRGSHRWAQSFDPVRLEGDAEPLRPLRERGVYLITGGLGGVGLLLAEYLARTACARLVLTSRTSYPTGKEREEWLATHGEDDGVSRKIRQVQALEELGASVDLVSADASDEGRMQEVVEQIYRQYGELNGVLHAAGITSGESLYVPATEIGPTEADEQFQPKVYGVYVLEKVLRGRELDFCLLFSSNAAVLGGMGLVAYSAANLFMDAFACHQNGRTRVPWISANWDPWPEETKKYEGVRTSVDQFAMTPEESVEAFKRIACMAPEGQIVVATGAFQARLEQWVKSNPLQDALQPNASASFSAHPRLNVQVVYVAPRNESERLITDIWQQVLGVQQVGVDDNFFDLGGHSLLMIQVQGKLREALQKEVSMVDLFKYPTVGALAEYLSQANGHKTQTEPEQERIEKQIEALNRKKELQRERAAFSTEARRGAQAAPTAVQVQTEQRPRSNTDILSLLAELSDNGSDEHLVKPTRIKRFTAEEEINSFGFALVDRLRGKVGSIMYSPHPFTRGAFVVVVGDGEESLLSYLADSYVDAPPDTVVYCLRRSELNELVLDGLFVPPSINQKPHLVHWLKHKGTVLYGEDVRDQIGEPLTDPRLLLENHLTGCMLYVRELLILPFLWKERYLSLIKELDRHLRYLMGTALLVHGEWDVEVETLPERFAGYYPEEAMHQTFRELKALYKQAEGMEEKDCRELALEAVWQFESFLRHFRRCTR